MSWFFFAPDVVYPEWVPKSARWIKSSEWAFWLNYDAQVRFSAPYEDCVKAAEAVIAAHQKEMHGVPGFDYSQRTIDVSRGLTPVGAGSAEENKWWFKPELIKRGTYYGKNSSHNPQILIDADRGIFFYKRTD